MNQFLRLAPRAWAPWLLCAALATLGGCADLPSSGPTADQIVADAKQPTGFDLVSLDPSVLDGLANRAAATASLGLAGDGDVDEIGPGDVLTINVFEVGPALFRSGSTTSSATGNATSLPPVPVGRDGRIHLPWVGELMAQGQTPDALAAQITAGLKGKSQDAQVVVSVHDNLANNVMVMGDVKRPGRIPLSLARERLLDAVALAGGSSEANQDNEVTLQRGASRLTAMLGAIQPGSAQDAILLPSDRIVVTYRPRTFTVFGATSKVSEIPFQSPRVSLAEALGRAGGPNDQQADPTAVFVFRYEPSAADGEPAPGAKPTAYRLNMLQGQSYLLAQRFEMKPRDVIYIANAQSNQPAKLLQILNLFFQPFYTAKVVSQR